MSYADKVFKENCREILNGTNTKDERVRPVWEDTGEPAYTIKKFGIVNTYDLRKEFPAITIRPTNLRAAYDEILWIWSKGSNDVNELNSKIWDQWADQKGLIGKAYGYQAGLVNPRIKIERGKLSLEDLLDDFEDMDEMIEEYPSYKIQSDDDDPNAPTYLCFNQMDY